MGESKNHMDTINSIEDAGMTNDKCTIEDIARELGLNKSTVSRAISGKGRVGKATRERVLSFVKERNYTPNFHAKGLANGKTYNLGFVFPEDYGETEIQFFRDCLKGVASTAENYDYDVLMMFDSDHTQGSICRVITNHKVDGFIIGRFVKNSFIQQLLEEEKVPYVVIGQADDPKICSVDNPNREACMELTEIMLMKGVRRLAFMGGKSTYSVSESRYHGFIDAHHHHEIKVNSSLIFSDIRNYYTASKAVKQAMEIGVDGIICVDDYITSLVLICLRESGIVVPEQIKLASFYDSYGMEYSVPPVTSLHFDSPALGRNACLMLLKQLGENVVEECAELDYQISLRKSTNN